MNDRALHVLLVDDDPLLRQTFSVVLGRAGYRVRTAEDGFSALAAIRAESPDIIVSDLQMPGMSGFELLSVIRRRFPSILAIAMSGAFTSHEIPAGVAADAFHPKGTPLGFFLETLVEVYRKSPSTQDTRSASKIQIWIARTRGNASEASYLWLTCPECMRAFRTVCWRARNPQQTACAYCMSAFEYSVVPEGELTPNQAQA